MQININKSLVEFCPQNAAETAELEALWRLLVDCLRSNKKLVPVGEYVSIKNKAATFAIEDVQSGLL